VTLAMLGYILVGVQYSAAVYITALTIDFFTVVFGYVIALDVIMQQPMEVPERTASHSLKVNPSCLTVARDCCETLCSDPTIAGTASKLLTICSLRGTKRAYETSKREQGGLLQMWQTIRSSVFDRHSHNYAYAAIVLSGDYEEAGDHGRFKVETGDTVLHERFEAHINRFSSSGAVVLNLALPAGTSFLPGLATIADPDLIVRVAEKNQVQAARLLLSSIAQREPNCEDWPDELASALIANPSLSLSRWSESKGLMPWAVSRGFMQVFSISPAAFRARTRKSCLEGHRGQRGAPGGDRRRLWLCRPMSHDAQCEATHRNGTADVPEGCKSVQDTARLRL